MRDLMAGPGSAQERLDKIAALIAREMVAEVCSVYVRRVGEVLETASSFDTRPRGA